MAHQAGPLRRHLRRDTLHREIWALTEHASACTVATWFGRERPVMRLSSAMLIAAVVAVLALVLGLLLGAVIVPWITSWLG
jgi:hypothetical protein